MGKIVINLDVMMAKRKIGLTELAKQVGISNANLSILKNNKAKAILKSIFSPLGRLDQFFKNIPQKGLKENQLLSRIITGLVISIAILSVIIPLLLSSDAIFNDLFNRFFGEIDYSTPYHRWYIHKGV